MSPPGLGFVAVDARAAAVEARNKSPRYYWDWQRRRGPYSYTKFCGTPPQNLLFGLEAAFALIEQEGVEAIIARHALIARAVQAAVEQWATGRRARVALPRAGSAIGLRDDDRRQGRRRCRGIAHGRARALPGGLRRRAGPLLRKGFPHRAPRRPQPRNDPRLSRRASSRPCACRAFPSGATASRAQPKSSPASRRNLSAARGNTGVKAASIGLLLLGLAGPAVAQVRAPDLVGLWEAKRQFGAGSSRHLDARSARRRPVADISRLLGPGER
jgi:hypothetical protein